ncbi:hypothetical protein L228DRAFT_260194 [Xylona heveae TC161]|uniref:Transcription factor SWI6 n=1 Tax=Xylona heveae (strain CBS 132557 / TC161) TaxID=1328760 RepID=A0A165HDS6_XYLHT|nr:hypothetical protein L228DRAFT_260194 [Xylona heveae TC161]KZF23354.1 hypothetical protein L228DRAFT_260194 [Xylona heveae TC161]
MASALQPVAISSHPSSYPHNVVNAAVAGLHLPQSVVARSFEGQPTPSPNLPVNSASSRPAPQHMSFNMNGQTLQNGIMVPQQVYRNYGEMDGHALPPPQMQPATRPQIYSAVYSGVSVYEMEVNKVAVMRRRSDSWLNATQILKVAGIDKGKRTKVLEKEILTGEHEKVQGGYGRYQGTWIRYERGVEFCRQYGVEELLRPLLEYDMGQDGRSMPGQGAMDTPTKEQAMAAQRKRLYNAGAENRVPGQSAGGTFFKNISSTASNAVAAIGKARFDSPAPRGNGSRPPNAARRSSYQPSASQESAFPSASQQSMRSLASENSFGGTPHMDTAYASQNDTYMTSIPDLPREAELMEPPRKRMRPMSSQETVMSAPESMYGRSIREETPTEPNESFVYHQHGHYLPTLEEVEEGAVGLQPLPQPSTREEEEKVQLLTSLFLDPSQTDFSTHPAFLHLSGEDLDLPLDSTAHTALHWAATLARLPLLKALISKGASIYRTNGGGETALIRACVVTNNLDQGSFPELLELLGPTIEMRDGRGRTVLHHIAVSSAVKGRSAASKYYLESLLEFVVRHGGSHQPTSFHGEGFQGLPDTGKTIGLARFMSEIVNAQDKSGDTALNLAARVGSRNIIHQLLEVNADAGIPNRGGLRPIDFGIGSEAQIGASQVSVQEPAASQDRTTVSKVVGETSRDIMSSISSLLAQTEEQFSSEMRAKQDQINQAHAKLRECSAILGEERRNFELLQQKAAERTEMKQKIQNLRRAAEEQKLKMAQSGIVNGDSSPPLHLVVGHADEGNVVKLEEVPADILNVSEISQLDHQSLAYLSSLPSVDVLQGRLAAYVANNANLREYSKKLKSQSGELEERYRRVVSLCTGVAENSVESLLGGLVAAVESEGGDIVEVGRVRDFLRKVEGVEG